MGIRELLTPGCWLLVLIKYKALMTPFLKFTMGHFFYAAPQSFHQKKLACTTEGQPIKLKQKATRQQH